jgi:CubicO group peptidase (beta-lactamase class C family)
MTTNQVGDIKDPRGLGFGFGFETRDKYGVNTMASVGSWGWGGAYGTWYLVDPVERLTIVLMLQMIPNNTDFRDKFDATLFGALIN